MFTPLLFDHKFDIDDILTALCGTAHAAHGGRWLLDTQHKQLLADTAGTLQEGGLNGHLFVIEPLPEAILTDLRHHPKLGMLEADFQAEILSLLAQTPTVADLPTAFAHGFAGGWLRERVKDLALIWLDARGLIPPSMRHVRDESPFAVPERPRKVSIAAAQS